MLDEKLLDMKELQELLGVTRQTIYRWIDKGLPRIKVNTRVRFNKAEVEKWIMDQNKEEE